MADPMGAVWRRRLLVEFRVNAPRGATVAELRELHERTLAERGAQGTLHSVAGWDPRRAEEVEPDVLEQTQHRLEHPEDRSPIRRRRAPRVAGRRAVAGGSIADVVMAWDSLERAHLGFTWAVAAALEGGATLRDLAGNLPQRSLERVGTSKSALGRLGRPRE